MALLNKTLSPIKQPNSVLQPKPGLMDAGGNQPKPVLQPNEQLKAPSITPANQAPSQFSGPQTGFLTPQQATAGPYSGYTAESSGTGNANILNRIPQGGADKWTPEQWQQAYQESQGNPFLAGTVKAQGIQQLYNDYISKGQMPDYNTIARSLGGASMSGYKPQGSGSVTLQPGEVQNANGVSKAPSITPATQPNNGADLGAVAKTGGLTPGNAFNTAPLSKNDKQGNPAMINAPKITPMASTTAQTNAAPNANLGIGNQTPTPPMTPGNSSEGDDSLDKIFKFFKGDLERERDLGLDSARTNAASRGVFYGTPGTQMEDDVRERYGRGLGQFQANLLQNESQNELQRLGLATNLFGTMQAGELGRLGLMSGLIPNDMEQSSGLDPSIFEAIASLFGGKQSAGGVSPAAVPQITNPNVKIMSNTPQAKPTLPNKKF